MNLDKNDIAIILGINLLEQDIINNLTSSDIRKCYFSTLKLYHPDNYNNLGELNTEFTKIINESYKKALTMIEDLRKTTSKKADENVFNSYNYPHIYRSIILEILKKNSDLIFILKGLRVIDSGFIFMPFLNSLNEIFGNNFKNLFLITLQNSDNPLILNQGIKLLETHLSYLENFQKDVSNFLNGVEATEINKSL